MQELIDETELYKTQPRITLLTEDATIWYENENLGSKVFGRDAEITSDFDPSNTSFGLTVSLYCESTHTDDGVIDKFFIDIGKYIAPVEYCEHNDCDGDITIHFDVTDLSGLDCDGLLQVGIDFEIDREIFEEYFWDKL